MPYKNANRIAPNLLERAFNAAEPNQVLADDITYVATSDGWLYLAVLLYLYSRRVVGWAMSDRIDTEQALVALHAAASTQALKPNWIHHTDRDFRYGSDELPGGAQAPPSAAQHEPQSRLLGQCGVGVLLRDA